MEMDSAKWAAESQRMLQTPEGEIAGGWFPWALREAVQYAGHHTSASKAQAFYAGLSEDLNRAFDEGTLPKDDTPIFFGFRLSGDVLIGAIKQIPNAIVKTVSFETCEPFPFLSEEPLTGVFMFQHFTGSRTAASRTISSTLPSYDKGTKLSVRHSLWQCYRSVYPWLFLAGMIGFILSTYLSFVRRKLPALFIVCCGLFLTFMTLSSVLCLIHVTSFPALLPLYFAPMYPLVILFPILSIYLSLQMVMSKTGREDKADAIG
jgi:hypothetical protein